VTIANASPVSSVTVVSLAALLAAGACDDDGAAAVDAAAVCAGDGGVAGDVPADAISDGPAAGEVAADAGTSVLAVTSGARLKARWWVAPDGRRLFAGWFDSQLATNCSFVVATDGVLRCLPDRVVQLTPSLEYADGGCTMPVVEAGRTAPNVYFGDTTCTSPAFIRQRDRSGCNIRTRVYRRGPEVSGGMIFTKLGTTCNPAFLGAGTTAYGLGDELPASSFVKAIRVVQPGAPSDRLQLVYREAEDGARQPLGWQPFDGDEDCRLLTLTDQRLHCLTSTGRHGNTFADASCSEPTAFVSSCGPVPALVERAEPGTCPRRYSIRKLGQRLDRVYTTLYTGTCMEESSTAYYAQGEAVSSDTFPALDERDDPTGRLRRRFRVGPGGQMMAAAWYDSARATICRVAPVGDKTRCIPEGDGLSTFFADRACTTPVKHVELTECTPQFAFDYDRRSCPLRARAFEVGAPYAGPLFELTFDRTQNPTREACNPVARRPDYAYHEVKEIPEADLPELQTIVD
jgi:hypothetical protein